MASTHKASDECEDSRIWHGEKLYTVQNTTVVTCTGHLHFSYTI